MAAFSLTVNGSPHTVDADPDSPLLYVLQEDLQLNGPKFGCGLGQCGACTVLLDGEPIRSCTTAMSDAAGHEVTTIEGLGTVDNPHPLQAAFIDEQAVHCGYCVSGPMLWKGVHRSTTECQRGGHPAGPEWITLPLSRAHSHG